MSEQLNKREQLAAAAMQGLLSATDYAASGGSMVNCAEIASDAVALADALIEELAGRGPDRPGAPA